MKILHFSHFNYLYPLHCIFISVLIYLFSLQEWGKSFTHEYLGAYRLEHDFSWTLAKDVEERAKNFAAIDKVLNSQVAITYDPNPNFNSLTHTNEEKADSNSKSKEGDVRIDDME